MFETKCNSNWSCSRAHIVFGMWRRTKQAWRRQKNEQIVFDGWKNKNDHEFIWSKSKIIVVGVYAAGNKTWKSSTLYL